jgi:hypothetical protein
MVTDTMHDLPLVVSKSSENKEIFEEITLMVDKVVSDADDSDQLEGSNSSIKICHV